MCGKCNNNNNNNRAELANDMDIEVCCGSKPQGARCVCLPYNDCFVITAQAISILALCISWIWWVTFLISIAGLVMLQIIWCCRQNRAGFIASVVVSGVTGLLCLFAAIYFLVEWRTKKWCNVFHWRSDDDDDDDDYYDYDFNNNTTTTNTNDYNYDYYDYYDYDYDYCNETAWAIVAFVDVALWLVVSGCLLYFVVSGRHAKWEAIAAVVTTSGSGSGSGSGPSSVAVELRPIPTAAAATSATGATSTTTATDHPEIAHAVLASDAYLPPEASQKMESATPTGSSSSSSS